MPPRTASSSENVSQSLVACGPNWNECRRDYIAHNEEVVGSSPTGRHPCGCSSMVERHISALFVVPLSCSVAATKGGLPALRRDGATPGGCRCNATNEAVTGGRGSSPLAVTDDRIAQR